MATKHVKHEDQISRFLECSENLFFNYKENCPQLVPPFMASIFGARMWLSEYHLKCFEGFSNLQVEPVGSTAEGINLPEMMARPGNLNDEQDFNLVASDVITMFDFETNFKAEEMEKKTVFTLEEVPGLPEYVKVRFPANLTQISPWHKFALPVLSSDGSIQECFLSPTMLISELYSWISCVTSLYSLEFLKKGAPFVFLVGQAGPAVHCVQAGLRRLGYYSVLDVAVCLQSRNWPAGAKEWFTRNRPSGWPNKEMLDKIWNDIGIHVVPKPELERSDGHLLWRISFGLAERELIRSLSLEQRNVFRILKGLVRNRAKDPPGLASFHLKTIFMYACETIKPEEWTVETTLDRLRDLLDMLSSRLQNAVCPHYFVPGFNVFGKIPKENTDELYKNICKIRESANSLTVYGLITTRFCPRFYLTGQTMKCFKKLLEAIVENPGNLKENEKTVESRRVKMMGIMVGYTMNEMKLKGIECTRSEIDEEVKLMMTDIMQESEKRQQEIWQYLSHRCRCKNIGYFPHLVASISDVLSATYFICKIPETMREKLNTLSTFLQSDLGTSYEIAEEQFITAVQDFTIKDVNAKLHHGSTQFQQERMDGFFKVLLSRAATLEKSADVWDHILHQEMTSESSSLCKDNSSGSISDRTQTSKDESIPDSVPGVPPDNETILKQMQQFVQRNNLYKREYGNVVRGVMAGQYRTGDLMSFAQSFYQDVVCDKVTDGLMSSAGKDLKTNQEKEDFEKLQQLREILGDGMEGRIDPTQMTMKISEVRKYLNQRFGDNL